MEAKQIRTLARERLQGTWGISIGVAAVACLLGGLLVGGSFLPELEIREQLENASLGEILYSAFQAINGAGLVGYGILTSLLGFASFILGGVIQLGYSKFLLKQYYGQNLEFNDLFSEFDRFGTGFAQAFLRGLYITLWSLLLIVPGIVASYRYAMTPFILIDHPEMTASQAIACSKAMMNGHKGELFYLDLTFLGWGLLAALTMNLGHLALTPYRNAAYAVFYKNLTQSQQGRWEV